VGFLDETRASSAPRREDVVGRARGAEKCVRLAGGWEDDLVEDGGRIERSSTAMSELICGRRSATRTRQRLVRLQSGLGLV